MIELLSMEFKKYKRSGIYLSLILGTLGLLTVVFLIFAFNKDQLSMGRMYDFRGVNLVSYKAITEFLTPIIAAFLIAYFISFEYKNKTIKNMLASSYSRWQILTAKFLFVFIIVFLFNLTVFLGCVPISMLLGINIDMEVFKNYFNYNCYWSPISLCVIPITACLTLLIKSFAVPFTISALMITLNKPLGMLQDGIFSPWTLSNKAQYAIEAGNFPGKPLYVLLGYCAVFFLLSFVYFEKSDQHA